MTHHDRGYATQPTTHRRRRRRRQAPFPDVRIVDSVRHGTLLTALFYGYSSVRALVDCTVCVYACLVIA